MDATRTTTCTIWQIFNSFNWLTMTDFRLGNQLKLYCLTKWCFSNLLAPIMVFGYNVLKHDQVPVDIFLCRYFGVWRTDGLNYKIDVFMCPCKRPAYSAVPQYVISEAFVYFHFTSVGKVTFFISMYYINSFRIYSKY